MNDERAMLEAQQVLAALRQLISGGPVNLHLGSEAQALRIAPMYDVIDLTQVMLRMQICVHPEDATYQGLESWMAAADRFQAAKPEIIHEGEVLAMFARLLQTDAGLQNTFSGLTTGKPFAAFAKDLETASLQILTAAESNNLGNAQQAIKQVAKTCTDCHDLFR